MTVEVERDALLAALRQVGGVVESRTTIPILANLLVEAREGALSVLGTNLDIHATAHVPAAGTLATTVDARKFEAAVASLKPGRLAITPVDGRAAITIKGGRNVRTLPTLPVQDFPQRAALTAATSFSLSSRAVLRLLDACQVAQSSEETRYYLIGTFVHLIEGTIRGVATDGHKLVRSSIAAPEGLTAMPDTIIPAKTVGHLRKALAKLDCDVAIEVDERSISFAFASTRLVSKVVEGTFPDYTRVIPQGGAHELTVVRDAIIDASTSVVAVVTAEGNVKTRIIRVELEPGEAQKLVALDSTGASADEALEARHEGPAIIFGVNQAYLNAIAGIFSEGATLSISLATPTSPLLLSSDKDPDLLAVIMPARA